MPNLVAAFAVGMLVGTMLSKFFTALTRDIVLPLLSPFASVEGGVSKLVVPIGSVKLNVGDLIVQTINLLISLTVLGFTLPYISSYIPMTRGGR